MYDAMVDAAVSLAAIGRMAPPVCKSAAALGYSLLTIQTVGHPRPNKLRALVHPDLVLCCCRRTNECMHFCRWSMRRSSAPPLH